MRVTHAKTTPVIGMADWNAEHVIEDPESGPPGPHSHPDLAHAHPYADTDHSHGLDEHSHNYAVLGHSHDMAHDHDGDYAPVHSHDFALSGHAHDLSHTHDAGAVGAAPSGHTHNYADPAHTHAAHMHDEYATDSDLATHAGTAHGLSSHAIDGVHHSGSEVLPSTGQKNALAGTTGTPGDANRYVTNADARLSNARSPTSHSHVDADLPAGLARDAEVTAAISAHVSAQTHGGTGEAFPVGSIYIAAVPTNPATLLGYGTWAAFGAGRVLLGGETDEQTGGSDTHSHANHTVTQPDAHTQILNHTHVMTASNTVATSGTNVGRGTGAQGSVTAPNPSGGVASIAHSGAAVSAHDSLNHLPPYITVHMWKRTA